jgi:hypothetical protein
MTKKKRKKGGKIFNSSYANKEDEYKPLEFFEMDIHQKLELN